MDNRHAILHGPITKTLFQVSWPMIVAFLLQTSFNIIDGIFVGAISAEALAAVTLAYPIFFILLSFAGGVGIGATSLIAQRIGAKKNPDVVANQSISLSVAMGILMTIIGLLVQAPLFRLFGAQGDVFSQAIQYSTILLIGSTTFFFLFIGNSIIRGEGNTLIPMYAMGGSAILNIILDYLLIFELGWGVQGAAIATVIARSLGGIFMIWWMVNKSFTKLTLKWFWNFKIIKDIYRIGIPASFSQFLMGINMLAMTAIITPIGVGALAAYGIGFRLESFVMMPTIGLMTAIIPIVGQNFGAKNIKRLLQFIRSGFWAASMWAIIMAAGFLAIPTLLASMFTTNSEVVAIASQLLRIVEASYILFIPSMIFLGGFLGMGKAIPSLVVQGLRLLVLSVPLAYIFYTFMGVSGVWLGISIAYAVSGLVAMIWWSREKRKVSLSTPSAR